MSATLPPGLVLDPVPGALPPGAVLDPPAVEAPNFITRVGHGADRALGGLHQAWLELKSTVDPAAKPELADYTQRLNDEEGLYQKGRGPNAGLDVASLIGGAGILAPSMLIPGLGETALARAGTGAIQGALVGASQPTETGHLADRAWNTTIGAATGGAIAPVAGVLTDKAAKLASVLGNRVSNAVSPATVEDMLKAVPEISTAPPSAQSDLIAEAQAQIRDTGTLDAASIARKANMIANGLKPTTAMVTRSPRDWTIERNLQKLLQSPDPALSDVGQSLTNVYQDNNQALVGKLADIGKALPTGNKEQQGDALISALSDLSKTSQKDVSGVYDTIRAQSGDQLASDARNVIGTLTSPDVADNAYSEPIIRSVASRLKRFGMIGDDGAPTTNTILRDFSSETPNRLTKIGLR